MLNGDVHTHVLTPIFIVNASQKLAEPGACASGSIEPFASVSFSPPIAP